MKTADLDYELPAAAIAQRPLGDRDGARLLRLLAQAANEQELSHWADSLPARSLLVLNDTRVRHARLTARRASGGGVELLLLRPVDPSMPLRWSCLARANRPLRVGEALALEGGSGLRVLSKDAGCFEVEFEPGCDVEDYCERHGRVPLPPYVRREPDSSDTERYQTLFSRELGSAAAPTAGLHLSHRILQRLEERGIARASVTLHVGAGTFAPVRTAELGDHIMHTESVSVPPATVAAVAAARERGAAVVAVGTTVVRALESAADPDRLGLVRPFDAATRLFIQPGYAFRVVDALLTNFHAPRSTLLSLLAAFAGRRRVLAAYRLALAAGFRFLSYGDAMWVPHRLPSDLGPDERLTGWSEAR